jgi:ATP-binding cassette subfamily B multidrug efflux pump
MGGPWMGGRGPLGEYNRKERKVSDTALLKRLMHYIGPYRSRIALIVTTMVLTAICNMTSPYLQSIAINQIIALGRFDAFYWWVPLFLGLAAVAVLANYLSLSNLVFVGEHIISELREDMMRHLQALSLRYFAEGETGQVMSRVTNDAEAVRVFFRMGISSIITDTVSLIGALIMMYILSPQLTLVSLVTIPIILGLTFGLGILSRKTFRKTRATIATLTSMTQESVAGMKVIQSFTKEQDIMESFDDAVKDNVDANVKAIRLAQFSMPMNSSLRVFGTVLILWSATLLFRSGALDVKTQLGDLVAFLQYQMLLFMPLLTLSNVYIQYQSAMAGLERMCDVLDTDIEVKELSTGEIAELPPLQKEIRFDHVNFGYDSKTTVIRDVSFNIPHNQKVAIVGPTGAGKSTLINLLCRFYDPLSGHIAIDGHDLKDVSLASLRSQIGIVLQDSFLFNTTVRENIRYGRPDASDEEVMDAARAVGAHDFIMRLPNGYDSMISEGSSNISLGQRQLISFARALLVDPRVLILDEATSSVDPYTELIIQNALQKLLGGRTAIIIAHRLSTVRSSDKIIVLNNGQVVEEGMHKELLADGGLYSLLYRSQLRDDVKI